MNRRDFLSFAAAAPVALPMAAQAIVARPEFEILHGVAGEFVFEPIKSDGFVTSRFVPAEIRSDVMRSAGRYAVMSPNEIRAIEDCPSVDLQMADHDLFELDAQVIADTDQQAPVSPEPKLSSVPEVAPA